MKMAASLSTQTGGARGVFACRGDGEMTAYLLSQRRLALRLPPTTTTHLGRGGR